MRISVNRKDQGYSKEAYMWRVYLDGKELGGCITADEELGTAECFAQDANGELFIDPQNPNEFKKVSMTGSIIVKQVGVSN